MHIGRRQDLPFAEQTPINRQIFNPRFINFEEVPLHMGEHKKSTNPRVADIGLIDSIQCRQFWRIWLLFCSSTIRTLAG